MYKRTEKILVGPEHPFRYDENNDRHDKLSTLKHIMASESDI